MSRQLAGVAVRVATRVQSSSRWLKRACFSPPVAHARTASSISHTQKWMAVSEDKKTPMELINAVPPIAVQGRVVACEGGVQSAIGHPVEYINLDNPTPNVCKYSGLRYYQDHHH